MSRLHKYVRSHSTAGGCLLTPCVAMISVSCDLCPLCPYSWEDSDGGGSGRHAGI